jgi:hypothetical protein
VKISANMLEGMVVTIIGVIILITSILLPENPIKFAGWLGIVVQAGFMPTILSLLIIILGFKLMTDNRIPASDKSAATGEVDRVGAIRMGTIVGFTTLYVVLLGKINFAILSFCYFMTIICYLKFTGNVLESHRFSTIFKIIIISCIFVLIVAYILPLMLRLQVP